MRRATTTAAHVNEAKPRINRAMRYLAVLRALPDRRECGRGMWMLRKHADAQLVQIDPRLRGKLGMTDLQNTVPTLVGVLLERGHAELTGQGVRHGFRITPEGRWLRELLGEAIEGARP